MRKNFLIPSAHKKPFFIFPVTVFIISVICGIIVSQNNLMLLAVCFLFFTIPFFFFGGHKHVILAYIALIPILKIAPYALNYSNPELGLLHIGPPGQGVGVDFIAVILFIGYALFWILQFIQLNMVDRLYQQYIANPGAYWLFFLTIFILIALISQTIVGHLPPIYILRKGRDEFTYLFLALIAFFVFKNDCWSLAKFSLYIATIVSLIECLGSTSQVLVRGGLAFERLEALSMGANSSSIYFAAHIPFCILFFKYSKGVFKFLWLLLAIFLFTFGLLTITRAYFVALAIGFLAWVYIQKNLNKKLLALIAITIILAASYSFLSALFVSDLERADNTFVGRIERGWWPAFQYTFSSPLYFFTGFPGRSFTAWTEHTFGYRQADHNITISYMTTYGVPAACCWLLLWASVFWHGIRYAKKSVVSREKNLLTACLISLLIYFSGAHSATVSGILFLTPVFIYITIVWITINNMEKAKRGVWGRQIHIGAKK